MATTRLRLQIDLRTPGRQVGDLMLPWSDNEVPLGYHPIPVISIKGGSGPRVLITGGTHGDEFEGPAAIMRLAQKLRPEEIAGQVILIPALNAPALRSASRVSPLDGANLNRAFPGDADGGPTAMLAHFIENELLPTCGAAIDLHSGGKASYFAPCALATHVQDVDLFARNMELARAFGLPLIWRLGPLNDNRSLNSAAARQAVPMIAAELGGGGGVDPAITDQAEAGLMHCLHHLGVLAGHPERRIEPVRVVELIGPHASLFATARGLFDRRVCAGQTVESGAKAGDFHFIQTPERPSESLVFASSGFVLAHSCRGLVERGDMLALLACDVAD